ncbi:MAG: ABC transporter ATP-binding protein [Candidatus Micrarchaeia archaeon]
MPDVVLKGVSKVFPGNVVALQRVDLAVKDKDYVVLLGPSGCGKTSLLKSIAGIYLPTSGSISIGKKDVTSLRIEDRNVGMMFQNYALFPHLSVEKNVSYGPQMRELPLEKTKEIAHAMLELAKFPLDRANAKPSELSGGMQQRVALARALASQSPIILLDEPLSALDAKIGEELRLELRRLVKKLGLTAIHVTHSQDEAMSTADTIVVMNNGEIMQVGTPEEVYFKPANLFVADFIGEANFFEAEVSRSGKKTAGHFLGKFFDLSSSDSSRLAQGANRAVVVIRPEKMVVTKNKPFHKNFVKGKISIRRFLGEKIRYEISSDFGEIVVKRMGFGRSFHNGDSVFISFDSADALLFDFPRDHMEKIVGRKTA